MKLEKEIIQPEADPLAEAKELKMPPLSEQGLEAMRRDLAKYVPKEKLLQKQKPEETPEDYKKRMELIKDIWVRVMHVERFARKHRGVGGNLKASLNTLELMGMAEFKNHLEMGTSGLEMMRSDLARILPDEKLFSLEITEKTPDEYKNLIKELWVNLMYHKRLPERKREDEIQLGGTLDALRLNKSK